MASILGVLKDRRESFLALYRPPVFEAFQPHAKWRPEYRLDKTLGSRSNLNRAKEAVAFLVKAVQQMASARLVEKEVWLPPFAKNLELVHLYRTLGVRLEITFPLASATQQFYFENVLTHKCKLTLAEYNKALPLGAEVDRLRRLAEARIKERLERHQLLLESMNRINNVMLEEMPILAANGAQEIRMPGVSIDRQSPLEQPEFMLDHFLSARSTVWEN